MTDMKGLVVILLFFVLLLSTSCDPDVTVDYYVTNRTDRELEVKIFGHRDQYNSIVQEYDTLIGQGERLNIYRFSSLGSGYTNPADTITVFDSIHVVKNGLRAITDFKKFETWDYSEKTYKYGGGHYTYDLIIESDDF